MIHLKTGLPRNGKTLSLVTELAALIARWEKHPEERRRVYQFGIPELKLPGVYPLEAWPLGKEKGTPIPLTPDGKPEVPLTFDQGDIPDGSLIVIDECQDFYPPRGPSAAVPGHVKALNTHGHRNIDYIVLTQHPKLIDQPLRRLVNKHQHYRRAMGRNGAVTYEWDSCSDNLNLKTAVTGFFAYPQKSFGLYKSATGFVRPKFKLPLFVWLPVLGLAALAYVAPSVFSLMQGDLTMGRQAAEAASAPGLGAAGPQGATRAPGSPGGAAAGDPVVRGVAAPPVRDQFAVAGCMAWGDVCRCVDQRGVAMLIPANVCRVSSASFDGIVRWAPRDPVPDRHPGPVDAGARPTPPAASPA